MFTHFHGYDIMYHVSTYLPFAAHDDKKVKRKRKRRERKRRREVEAEVREGKQMRKE